MHLGISNKDLAMALITFFWDSSLQATTTNEFVRKFVTSAWPVIKFDNIVWQRMSEVLFFVLQISLLES